MEMRKLLNIINESAEMSSRVMRDHSRILSDSNGMGTIGLQQQLAKLIDAQAKATKITSRIKNEEILMSILTELSSLAENSGVDIQQFKYAQDEVFEKARELQSAVYGLEDVFKDAVYNVKTKLEDSEDDRI